MKTIDLVKNEKGEYVPKNDIKMKSMQKQITAVQTLFDGIDAGLNFFEELEKRLIRLKRLGVL